MTSPASDSHPPPSPAARRASSTRLAPLSQEEFDAWLTHAIPGYAADKVAAGQWTQAEALARARAEILDVLPKGMKTADQHFYALRDDTDAGSVGCLWIGAQDRGAHRIAYVYDVWIHPDHRRRGHARRAFVALEQKVRELGLAGVALHVFGHNAAARALYASLDYETTNVNMFKAVARDDITG